MKTHLLHITKGTVFLGIILIVGASCSPSSEVARATSPNGKAVAVILERETPGLPRISEPPKSAGRWAKLSISRGSFSTDFEVLNIYDHASFATDLAWSPDSEHLAYRRVNQFRVFGPDNKPIAYNVVTGNSLIASFRWIDTNSLLVVTKTINDPLDLYGKPDTFHGYLARSRAIRIIRINLAGLITERYTLQFPKPEHVDVVDMYGPTFIFRSAGFLMDEISPSATKVAFGDGTNLCVFDDRTGKVIVQKPLANQIEGVWWLNDDIVLLGLDLLSSNQMKFVTFSTSS